MHDVANRDSRSGKQSTHSTNKENGNADNFYSRPHPGSNAYSRSNTRDRLGSKLEFFRRHRPDGERFLRQWK